MNKNEQGSKFNTRRNEINELFPHLVGKLTDLGWGNFIHKPTGFLLPKQDINLLLSMLYAGILCDCLSENDRSCIVPMEAIGDLLQTHQSNPALRAGFVCYYEKLLRQYRTYSFESSKWKEKLHKELQPIYEFFLQNSRLEDQKIAELLNTYGKKVGFSILFHGEAWWSQVIKRFYESKESITRETQFFGFTPQGLL